MLSHAHVISDQEDFASYDDITLQQELMLLKAIVQNSSTMTDFEFNLLKKEIRDMYVER